MADFAVVSREPIIREYDHEVQGNTVLKPLAGATGDAPQDATAFAVNGSEKYVGISVSILPEWGKTHPAEMGAACVDEVFRQLVACGCNPDKIALLDNFCMGNPDDPKELGALVETIKGMAAAAEVYGAPFVSGKDSFYNYFETKDGPISIPVTLLSSGMGIIDDPAHLVTASIREPGSILCLVGPTEPQLGGSVYARIKGLKGCAAPKLDAAAALERYRRYYEGVDYGFIHAAHDVSEGGIAAAAAEMAFSGKAGVDLYVPDGIDPAISLFSESPGRILVETEEPENLAQIYRGAGIAIVGKTVSDHRQLRVIQSGETILEEEISELKSLWKNGLTPYY
jgi:phosphoribosylformylglycinamidine synthase